MIDDRFENDPFPSSPPPREPSLLDQVNRQVTENHELAKEIADALERRLSTIPPRRRRK
jgi:hypothetical protein